MVRRGLTASTACFRLSPALQVSQHHYEHDRHEEPGKGESEAAPVDAVAAAEGEEPRGRDPREEDRAGAGEPGPEPLRVVEVEEVAVERGDLVKKGQIVARLKSGQEKAALDLARANVEFLKRKMERNVELARKKLISAHENDELETELRKAELQLEEVQERYNMRTIKSTLDGVVAERLLAPGDYVGDAPIVKLASLDPLKVEVIVPVRRYGVARLGMRAGDAEFTPAALS